MTDPTQILRTALVAVLADMLREAEARIAAIEEREDDMAVFAWQDNRKDAAAICRVIAIMGREGK